MPNTKNRMPAADRPTSMTPVEAARALIVERGVAALSLRGVAERAGIATGSIAYRLGSRSKLLGDIVTQETASLADARESWLERLDTGAIGHPGLLVDLVLEWLDDATTNRRSSSIVTAEVTAMGARTPDFHRHLTGLFAQQHGLWLDTLHALGASGDDAILQARRIENYCADELVFSLALGDLPEYRLLRQSTVRALVEAPEQLASATSSAWHMGLVTRLGPPAALPDVVRDSRQSGLRGTISEHIADEFVRNGLGAISHRSIARASQIAVSSIAHHFPTQRELLIEGVEALYRRLRSDLKSGANERPSGEDVILLTHECALAALRDLEFVPFAVDMRRRRGENVRQEVCAAMGLDAATHCHTAQAVVMAMIGRNLRAMADGRGAAALATLLTELA